MHVAVFGAGYAGVALVRKLERSLADDVDLTLVDERDSHLVQHLVHRVVREPELADRLTVPLSDICRRAAHRRARVVDIDADAGRATLEDGTIEYDVGAVCLGARTAFHGLPGVKEHATPLKRLSHAHEIREAFRALKRVGGRAVVGGAGLSGIQIAGELAALAHEDHADGGPESASEADRTRETGESDGETEDVDVLVLEQEESVAPTFPPRFREAVGDELESRGVAVRTGVRVTGVDGGAVHTEDGDPISYDELVWTGGITGTDAVGSDRPVVQSTLRLGDRTFGLGDAVRVLDADGTSVPASAQTAVSQASVVARNVEKLVADARGDGGGFEPRLDRYEHDSPGWVVTVGDGTVAQVGSGVFRGQPALALKAAIGARHLTSVGEIEDAMGFVRETFAH